MKISALPAATTPTGPELVPIVQGGTTKRTTVSALGVALPLTPVDGGTGLTTLGTALQVLQTNSGATAIAWGTIPGVGTSVTTAVNATLTNAQVFCRVTASGKTITLPASPVDGQIHEIKTAGAFTCDVAGNGHNIDGSASYTQGTNRENTRLRYDAGAGEWEIR